MSMLCRIDNPILGAMRPQTPFGREIAISVCTLHLLPGGIIISCAEKRSSPAEPAVERDGVVANYVNFLKRGS